MSGRVELSGFDELAEFLTHAPDQIREQAMAIIREETTGAAQEIADSYPVKTGTLAKRVVAEFPASAVLVGVVRSKAPHAHLYEFGTTQRRNSKGANRGVMPAHKVTPAIAQRRRARMTQRLIEMVRRMGFQIG